jgi:hypothetical protein
MSRKIATARPRVHGDDFRQFSRALHQVGYQGRLALEPDWTDLRSQAAPAVAAIRVQLADAGYQRLAT